jgi:hypothetical protein
VELFHAARYLAEGGEALAVGVAFAAEVQFRLIAYADEEGSGGAGADPVARNREGPVPMAQAGAVSRLVSDRRRPSR